MTAAKKTTPKPTVADAEPTPTKVQVPETLPEVAPETEGKSKKATKGVQESFKALADEFKKGFDVELEADFDGDYVTFREAKHNVKTSTGSLRNNWLKRRGSNYNLQPVAKFSFRYVAPKGANKE